MNRVNFELVETAVAKQGRLQKSAVIFLTALPI